MRGDETLVERRALVIAVAVCVVGALVVSVSGRPGVGIVLFALACVGVAIEYARGHLP